MAECRIGSTARIDIAMAFAMVGKHGIASFDRFAAQLARKCNRYAERPLEGIPRDELHDDLRCFLVGNFIAYYRPIDGGIEIVRLLHKNSNIDAHQIP